MREVQLFGIIDCVKCASWWCGTRVALCSAKSKFAHLLWLPHSTVAICQSRSRQGMSVRRRSLQPKNRCRNQGTDSCSTISHWIENRFTANFLHMCVCVSTLRIWLEYAVPHQTHTMGGAHCSFMSHIYQSNRAPSFIPSEGLWDSCCCARHFNNDLALFDRLQLTSVRLWVEYLN